jgi:general secretion pathway protein N
MRQPAGPGERQRWQRQQHAGRRWAAWGVTLGLLAGVAANAPAQWLADGLHQASAQRLLLAEARGSLWNGSAVLVLTGGAGSHGASALPGRLQWQLRPDWRGLRLTARQDCCINGDLALRWQPGWGGYTVALDRPTAAPPGVAAGQAVSGAPAGLPVADAVIGHWPAAWLAGLGTPWNTLQLGGLMQLASPGLRLQSAQGRLRLDGALSLELLGVSSRLSSLPALGSYRLDLAGQAATGDAATVQLRTLDGALRLSGGGSWTGTGLRFRGEAQAAEGQAPALANLLNIIGRRQGALSVISIG